MYTITLNHVEISEERLLELLPDRIEGETVAEWQDRHNHGKWEKDEVYEFLRRNLIVIDDGLY